MLYLTRLRKAKLDLEEKIMPQTCKKYEDLNIDDMRREIKIKPHHTSFSCEETRFTDDRCRGARAAVGSLALPSTAKRRWAPFSYRPRWREIFSKWQPAETCLKTLHLKSQPPPHGSPFRGGPPKGGGVEPPCSCCLCGTSRALPPGRLGGRRFLASPARAVCAAHEGFTAPGTFALLVLAFGCAQRQATVCAASSLQPKLSPLLYFQAAASWQDFCCS